MDFSHIEHQLYGVIFRRTGNQANAGNRRQEGGSRERDALREFRGNRTAIFGIPAFDQSRRDIKPLDVEAHFALCAGYFHFFRYLAGQDMLYFLQYPLGNHILAEPFQLAFYISLVKRETMGIRRHHTNLVPFYLQQGSHKQRTCLVRRAGENSPPDQFFQHDAVDREFLSLSHGNDFREI